MVVVAIVVVVLIPLLQFVLHAAACLVYQLRKYDHIFASILPLAVGIRTHHVLTGRTCFSLAGSGCMQEK